MALQPAGSTLELTAPIAPPDLNFQAVATESAGHASSAVPRDKGERRDSPSSSPPAFGKTAMRGLTGPASPLLRRNRAQVSQWPQWRAVAYLDLHRRSFVVRRRIPHIVGGRLHLTSFALCRLNEVPCSVNA